MPNTEHVSIFARGWDVWDRFRQQHPHVRPDLSGTDLASIARGDLMATDLRGADLRGANLRGADLTGADLTGADLTGADLTGADLTLALFVRAWVPEACFEGATMEQTLFMQCMGLDRAVGLEPDGEACPLIAATRGRQTCTPPNRFRRRSTRVRSR